MAESGESFWRRLWTQVSRPMAAATIAVVFLIGCLVGWGLSPAGPTSAPAAADKKQVWVCSMNYTHHPYYQSDKPGNCGYCGMPLEPVAADQAAEAGRLRTTISEVAAKLMDIQTSPVERKFVTAEVRMAGKIDYDETRLAYITAWVPGRIDRMFVDYTGVPVRKGDHLVELYSPELLSAQEELLQAAEAVRQLKASDIGIVRHSAEATVTAVREKLRLWGMTPEQIQAIQKRGKGADRMTIYSPVGGIVIRKEAQQGMYVKTGTRIYTIADLSRVWVKLDAYESDLMWLRIGQKVSFTTVSHPGEEFTGTISFIAPVLSSRTRTVKVRVNAANLAGKLKPGMFVKAAVKAQVAAGGRVMDASLAGKWMCPMHPSVVKDKAGKCDICGMPLVRTESLGYAAADPAKADRPLVIPVTAALVTGKRAVVYVAVPNTQKPTFEWRVVKLGPRAGDYYIVKSGLAEGERVVTKGSFAIDSERQIRALPSMMNSRGAQSPPPRYGTMPATAPATGREGHVHE